MSKPAKSCLQFDGYEVNNVHFELSQYYECNKEYQISPTFSLRISDCKDNKYKVQLSLSLVASDENPLPFSIEVVMTGKFFINLETENEVLKQALLHENTVAIMFPFLRAIIASLTTTANIAPLILPIVNLVEAFKNEDITKEPSL